MPAPRTVARVAVFAAFAVAVVGLFALLARDDGRHERRPGEDALVAQTPPAFAPPSPSREPDGTAEEEWEGASYGPSEVDWIDDLERGLAVARRTGRLAFVYVEQRRPHCPACALLQRRVFSDPASAVLGERWVAIRVPRGKDPEAEQAFHRKYDVRWSPALFALAHDGDLVTRDFGPLLPPMTFDGRVMEGSWDEGPTVEDLVATMERAEEKERSDRARLAALVQRDDARALREQAELLASRKRLTEATEALRRAYEREDVPEDGERLAQMLIDDDRRGEAVTVLERLAADHADHARRYRWLLDAARMRIDAQGALTPAQLLDRHRSSLEAIAKGALAGRRPRAAADAWLELGFLEARDMSRLDLAHGYLERALPLLDHGDGWSPTVGLRAAMLAQRVGRFDAAETLLRRILRDHPKTPEAESVSHGMLDAVRRAAAVKSRGASRPE
jgi:hypothetical protein